MSGHSKWKTIQHKKSLMDAKRGQLFSKLAREIMVAARQGGGDPDTNPALRQVLQKAKSANMPSENIERAIKKGTGELEGQHFEEVIYECFAQGGIAVLIIALTDNKNRTTSEIRHIITRHGTNFASQGSVSRLFHRKGQIFIDGQINEDTVMGIVLDAGAEDMKRDGNQFEILTNPSDLSNVVSALEKNGIKPLSAEVAFVPETYIPVTDINIAQNVMKLVQALEDHDDVQNVYTNMDVSDEIIAQLEA